MGECHFVLPKSNPDVVGGFQNQLLAKVAWLH